MRRVLVLAVMALFTLMMGVSYSQTDICKNFKYQDVKSAFGQPIDKLTGGTLTFQETKDGVSYYNLTCEGGFFQWIPTGKQEIPQNAKISWAFVEKSGKKMAYARLIRMNVHDTTKNIEGITQNIGVKPSVKMEDGAKVYTWHAKEGVTTKMKIYNVKDPHKHAVRTPLWREVKIAQYLDKLRPKVGVVQKHLSNNQKK